MECLEECGDGRVLCVQTTRHQYTVLCIRPQSLPGSDRWPDNDMGRQRFYGSGYPDRQPLVSCNITPNQQHPIISRLTLIASSPKLYGNHHSLPKGIILATIPPCACCRRLLLGHHQLWEYSSVSSQRATATHTHQVHSPKLDNVAGQRCRGEVQPLRTTAQRWFYAHLRN